MIKNKMSFEDASALGLSYNSHPTGIGEYKEKAMHAILKNYYESDTSKQEIKIDRFYCDILNEYGIIEIQTRNFNTMRDKLTLFLQNYDVTIVYPMIHDKYINWVNSENEKDYMRKSPRHDNLYKAAKELYKIKTFLDHPRLHFVFLFCDVIELKNLDGWNQTKKKGSTSMMKIPSRIDSEIAIEHKNDYLKYVHSDCFTKEFTIKEFGKMNKASARDAQLMLNIFQYLGLVKVIRKENRKNIYRFEEKKDE